jgi:TonB family protein
MNVPTAAVAGPAWQPAGGWTIRQDNHCVAELRFAHKSKQVQFAIEPRPTSGPTFAYFVTDGDAQFGWVKADIAIGTKWKQGQTMQVMPSKLPHHIVYKWGLSDEQVGELETAGRVQVVSEDLRVDLSLPGVTAARAQLQTCDSALLARWGFGPEQQSRIASFPTMVKAEIKENDYPIPAARRGSIGDVNGYLTVGADGKASNCHVLDSSGWPELDSQSCELLVQRPQYKPATDKAGNAMAAPFYFEFVWH